MDLGNDHHLMFMQWAPADTPENRSLFGVPDGQPMPVVEKFGATIEHRRSDGQPCVSTIHFSGDWQKVCSKLCVPPAADAGIDVQTVEPLTCTQPVLCEAPIADVHGMKVGTCGDHGKIQNSKWIPI